MWHVPSVNETFVCHVCTYVKLSIDMILVKVGSKPQKKKDRDLNKYILYI